MSAAQPKLLIVDDGEGYVELAHQLMRQYTYATRCDEPGPCWTCPHRAGCQLTHAHDADEAEAALARHPDVDLVLLDMVFDVDAARLSAPRGPGEGLEWRRRHEGLRILERLRARRPELPVVLMTSRDELSDEAAAAAGRDEMLTLAGDDTFSARALALTIERMMALRRTPPLADYLWGETAAMARLRQQALALARTSLPMLILGETGTGKSALAEHVIHAASGRGGPFVAVDLAAIPAQLVASELFGAARGAFSGAVNRIGRIEAADGGTLFLDEIGNLGPEAQHMLLQALEERRVTRLGESRARGPLDVKLVAATNADLPARVAAGTFRADLFARLNPAARLALVPLRERKADLAPLFAAFVARAFSPGRDRRLVDEYAGAVRLPRDLGVEVAFARAPAAPSALTFVLPASASAALRRHQWPGNIRELAQLAANVAVLALADALEAARRGVAVAGRAAYLVPLPANLVERLLAPAGSPSPAPARSVRLAPHASLRAVARDVERQLYQQLFEELEGDFARMAERLLGKSTPAHARKVRLRFNQLGLRVKP